MTSQLENLDAGGQDGPLVYVGCYTPRAGGTGRGITVCRPEPGTGRLVPCGEPVPAVAPSYLAAHPSGRFLYAVGELEDEGLVEAFAVDGDGLAGLGGAPSGGAAPCHLAVDPTGRFLAVANYGGGSVTLHPVTDDGAVGAAATLVRLTGSGPVAGRQEAPHAHQVTFAQGGEWLVVCDLGSDTVYHLRFDAEAGTIEEGPKLSLPPGSGPRHIAYGPGDEAWLASELDATVTPLRADPGTGALAVAGKPVALSGGYPSGIVAAPGGGFVCVANRGPDTVAVLADTPGGLVLRAEVPSGGRWPRDLAFVGDLLYVANERSDTVTVFRWHAHAGELEPLGVALETGAPACVLAVGGP